MPPSSPPPAAGTQGTNCIGQSIPWNVVHACEQVRDVLDVAESQLTVGMRPFLLTPTGGASAALYLAQRPQEVGEPDSLLTAWGQVRGWRKALFRIEGEGDYNLLHAHSFASGMAAVRSSLVTVYDLRAFIEQLAVSRGNCEEKSWLARSFRVARSNLSWDARRQWWSTPRFCKRRAWSGARPRNRSFVFLIPCQRRRQ